MTERTLTGLERAAIQYFNLDYAESDEPGAGWFCYTDSDLHPDYPGSSCECLCDVVEWYKAAQQVIKADAEKVATEIHEACQGGASISDIMQILSRTD